jgi:hypothetical protein
MTDDQARHALEQALPQGWALDDAKPIVGSHWQIELVEIRDERDVRLSVCTASFETALDTVRRCGLFGTLVEALPSKATVEIYVGARTPG